jgi:hypothetical protein
MKFAIFWYIAPCSTYMNRRFGGTYHLHLQGRKSAECSENSSALRISFLRLFRPPPNWYARLWVVFLSALSLLICSHIFAWHILQVRPFEFNKPNSVSYLFFILSVMLSFCCLSESESHFIHWDSLSLSLIATTFTSTQAGWNHSCFIKCYLHILMGFPVKHSSWYRTEINLT